MALTGKRQNNMTLYNKEGEKVMEIVVYTKRVSTPEGVIPLTQYYVTELDVEKLGKRQETDGLTKQ